MDIRYNIVSSKVTAMGHALKRHHAPSATVLRPSCFRHVLPQRRGFDFRDGEIVLLNRLRWFAVRSRLSAHEDIEKACFLLSGKRDVSFERFGLLFFLGLDRHGRHDVSFHKPGAKSASKDEVWLLNLLRALDDDDASLASRMLNWHVQPSARRWMWFLANGLHSSR